MQRVNRVIILVKKLARQLELVVCSRAFQCTSRITGSNLYKTQTRSWAISCTVYTTYVASPPGNIYPRQYPDHMRIIDVDLGREFDYKGIN